MLETDGDGRSRSDGATDGDGGGLTARVDCDDCFDLGGEVTGAPRVEWAPGEAVTGARDDDTGVRDCGWVGFDRTSRDDCGGENGSSSSSARGSRRARSFDGRRAGAPNGRSTSSPAGSSFLYAKWALRRRSAANPTPF